MLVAQPVQTGHTARGSEAHLALVDEKATLLRTLKELEFERDMGKISDQDFDALNTRYRERAKAVMRSLDTELGDFHKQAVALVEKELAKVSEQKPEKKSAKNSAAAGDGQKKPNAEAAPAARVCGACQIENDSDAMFCKKCGKALAGEDA